MAINHDEKKAEALESIRKVLINYDYVVLDTNVAMNWYFPLLVSLAAVACVETNKKIVVPYSVMHELRKKYDQSTSSTNPDEISTALYAYTGMYGLSILNTYGVVTYNPPLGAQRVLDGITGGDDSPVTFGDKELLFFVQCCFNAGKSVAILSADHGLAQSVYDTVRPACVEKSPDITVNYDLYRVCAYGKLDKTTFDRPQAVSAMPAQNGYTPRQNAQQGGYTPRTSTQQQQRNPQGSGYTPRAGVQQRGSNSQGGSYTPRANAQQEPAQQPVKVRPAQPAAAPEARALTKEKVQQLRERGTARTSGATSTKMTYTEIDSKVAQLVNGTLVISDDFDKIFAVSNVDAHTVILSESVERIMSRAFEKCPRLETLVIPSSVVAIDEHAFVGCENLIIYCEAGSYAQKYLSARNRRYELLV